MNISIKCYATLAAYQPEEGDSYPIGDRDTLGSLLKKLGLDASQVKIAFVNGRHATLDTKIRNGDRVAMFPAIGGG